VHVQVVCKLFWKFIILNDHNTGLTGLGLAKSKLSALEALDFSRHLASCARTLSMAPLSGAEADAIRSFFSSKRGDRALIVSVRDALITYFVDAGTPLGSLNTARPAHASREAGWLAEWGDAADAAQIADVMNKNNVVRWIEEDEVSAAAGGTRSGKAAAVADALTRSGVVVDRRAELAITAALAETEAGEMQAQSQSIEVVWLLYLGRSPGEEERSAYAEMKHAGQNGSKPTVDIRLMKAYAKQLSTTSVPTLERALRDSSGRVWNDYYASKIAQFRAAGFYQAAMRFIDVVSYANKLARGDIRKLLRYLTIYFFEEHLGLGMPEEQCVSAALQIASLDSSSQIAELQPTVPSEAQAPAWNPASMWGMQGAASVQQHMFPQQPAQMLPPMPMPGMTGWSPHAQQMPVDQLAADMGRWSFSPHQMQQMPQQMQQMAYYDQLRQLMTPSSMPGQQALGGPSMPPRIEEFIPASPAEQNPCVFCGGNHVQSKCTKFKQARDKCHQEAQDRAAAARKKREDAAAGAVAAGAAPSP